MKPWLTARRNLEAATSSNEPLRLYNFDADTDAQAVSHQDEHEIFEDEACIEDIDCLGFAVVETANI
jgi:hypothetical protein